MTSRIVLKVKLAAASHNVMLADSFESLLEQAQTEVPELIIIPAKLGTFHAPEICQALRLSSPAATVPIILISEQSDSAIRVAALKAGADDIVDLPFHDPLLLGRVRNALRAASTLREVSQHEAISLDLGLGEQILSFKNGPKICMVEAETDIPSRLSALMVSTFGWDAVRKVSHEEVLTGIQSGGCSADAFVISAKGQTPASLLQITAEIRCHPQNSHCIISLIGAEECADTVSALDVGASDLLPCSSSDEEIILRLENQLARKRHLDGLKSLVGRGLALAATDPLTGLYNRRFARNHARIIAAKALETQEPFAVLILDIDHFKRINDTFGHGAGDLVLQTFASRLQASIREVDLLSRIGGEEFLVILPSTGPNQAKSAAERLKKLATDQPIRLPGVNQDIHLTVSIGLVVGTPDSPVKDHLDDLISLADKALLASKAAGRNLVTVSQTAA